MDEVSRDLPPPPTANAFPPPPAPAAAKVDPQDQDLRGLNIVATIAAVALMLQGFLLGLLSGSGAFAIGSAVGSLFIPVIVGAIVGWGNDRRARITFVCVAAVFFLLRLGQLAA